MDEIPDDMTESAALLRFLHEESPADERAFVERWIGANPAHRAELERLDRAWTMAAVPREPAWDTKALWRQLEGALDGPDGVLASDAQAFPRGGAAPRLTVVPATRRSRWSSPALQVAAAAVLVVGVGSAVYVGRTRQPMAATVTASTRTVTAQRGQRAEFRLPDGSAVTLGAGSTLRISEPFGAQGRELYLEGEAYFEAAHDAAHPFRVRTAYAVTEDLGTHFAITAFPNDTANRVVVTEGSVSVRGGVHSEPVVLKANDLAHISAAGAVRAVRHVAPERYLGWVKGIIRFDDATLAAAIPVLERQYNITIITPDRMLLKRKFTGAFPANRLDEALKGLAFLLDAQYRRSGKKVMLSALNGGAPGKAGSAH